MNRKETKIDRVWCREHGASLYKEIWAISAKLLNNVVGYHPLWLCLGPFRLASNLQWPALGAVHCKNLIISYLSLQRYSPLWQPQQPATSVPTWALSFVWYFTKHKSPSWFNASFYWKATFRVRGPKKESMKEYFKESKCLSSMMRWYRGCGGWWWIVKGYYTATLDKSTTC